jgi:hypothetical protein
MKRSSPFTDTMATRWREVEDLEAGIHAMTERLGKMHRLFWESIRQMVPDVPPKSVLTIDKENKEIVWYDDQEA